MLGCVCPIPAASSASLGAPLDAALGVTPDALAALQGSLAYTLPEIIVALGLLTVLLLGLMRGAQRVLVPLAGVVLAAAAVALVAQHGLLLGAAERGPLWGGALTLDGWALWFKALVLGGGAAGLLLLMATPTAPDANAPNAPATPRAELLVLLLAVVLGGLLLAGASHLLLAFLSLELMSLAAYALVALAGPAHGPVAARRAEAATKYAVYGAVSAALTLYGISLIYGLGGTLQVGAGLSLRLSDADGLAAAVALSFVLVGLAFKLSAAPFHFWAPDVYAGASVGVVSLLAIASKLGALALLLRLADAVSLVAAWPYLIGALALVSLTVGSLGALRQGDYKRLLAYGGVAQAGYLLLGVAVGSPAGVNATLVYALVYALLTALAFGAGAWFAQRAGSDDSAVWLGLGRQHPSMAAAMAVAMLGLIGLPPTAGFVAKLAVFAPLVQALQTDGLSSPRTVLAAVLLAAGLIYTVVSVFFYLRLPARLLLEGAVGAGPPPPLLWRALLLLLAAAVIYLGTLGAGLLLR